MIMEVLNKSDISKDDIQFAQYLVSRGAFLNEPFLLDGEMIAPVIYYAQKGDTARLQFLLESLGADANKKDSRGLTPLYYILKGMSCPPSLEKLQELENAAQLLIDYDADIESVDIEGNTLLMKLAQEGNIYAVKLLTSELANTLATNSQGENASALVDKVLQAPNIEAHSKKTFNEIASNLQLTSSNRNS